MGGISCSKLFEDVRPNSTVFDEFAAKVRTRSNILGQQSARKRAMVRCCSRAVGGAAPT